MKSILDPTFKYVPSVETDLRKTFARIKREARANAEKNLKVKLENVRLLKGKSA